jgi:hypothetical protein
MKKYRCLWYMSTRNHNILYLAHIQGIWLLNIGNRLWKAQNSLLQGGFCSPRFCLNFCAPEICAP